MEGAPRCIGCTGTIRRDVESRLAPPFEDLFDQAEEHVLEVLYDAWTHMLTQDVTAFDKVCILEMLCILCLAFLQNISLFHL